MELIVIGYQVLDYVNRQGRPVRGIRLYGVYDNDRVTGQACEAVFISGVVQPPELESTILITYNKYGRACSWSATE